MGKAELVQSADAVLDEVEPEGQLFGELHCGGRRGDGDQLKADERRAGNQRVAGQGRIATADEQFDIAGHGGAGQGDGNVSGMGDHDRADGISEYQGIDKESNVGQVVESVAVTVHVGTGDQREGWGRGRVDEHLDVIAVHHVVSVDVTQAGVADDGEAFVGIGRQGER